ncbi:nucleophile aminohydrolase [Radiomyces spectabilis]|uniref:nucleophile aminohydrolase n=1 Tax=Radiomyces spectabilis TaxID=64574 RepID=UPI00221F0106|nr:nucleophile aminohydrolase [Radiomyces spectabilis]KAI8374399.1 nucleophile aminohydrolase [Radiomyces spectabilis]
MCRLLVYKGKRPILLSDLLTRPCHSIINQSFDSKLRIDHRRPLNGDGFGVGWYESEPEDDTPDTPCIFTSVTPAWNNTNLTRLSEKIKSPLVFAHVRASTSGAVTEANCHPWHYGQIMWMHNGGIAQFEKIKRKLQNSLPEELFLFVQGNTDSEWAFALYLSFLANPNAASFEHQELKDAMVKTIAQINAWAEEAGITEPSLLNFAVTDGQSVVCVRYISSKTEEAASLYFSSGTRFESYRPGHYRMIKADRREDMVVVASGKANDGFIVIFFLYHMLNSVIVSEPLTFEKADWLTIPTNNVLVITPKLNVLLQPIKDQFYTGDRGIEVKVGEEEVARIPEPNAQMFKAQAEEQLQQERSLSVA